LRRHLQRPPVLPLRQPLAALDLQDRDAPDVPAHPLRYFGEHRRAIAVGISALLLTNGLAQSIPWVIKRTIDVIGRHQGSHIAWLVALIGVLALAQALIRVVSRVAIFNAGRDAEYQLRGLIFAHLCQLDGSF
jgi:ABC-type multidrug transport system fused ATPase/permease subunit